MVILGLSAYYHDSAAALVRDGDIVAAAQKSGSAFDVLAIGNRLLDKDAQNSSLVARYESAFQLD